MADAEEEEINTGEPTFSKLIAKYSNKMISTVIIIGILIYLYFQVGLAASDSKAFTSNFIYNIFAIVLPVIAILCFILLTTVSKTTGVFIIVGTIFAIAIFVCIFYFLQSSLSQYIFNKYLLYIIIGLGILILLSIISVIFSDTLRRQLGWTGFFANLLFFIPCLIRDGIHGAIQEYKTFSTTLAILFVLEVIILMMYFWLIPLLNSSVIPGNVSLLSDPIMLNKQTGLSLAPITLPSPTAPNCAISMWIYVNPAPNTKPSYAVQTPIFTYTYKNGYIALNYKNDKKHQFNIDISGSTATNILTGDSINPVPVSMPLQKWNNVVFNITTSDVPEVKTGTPEATAGTPEPPPITTIDVFINGTLVASMPVREIPSFTTGDSIQVGSKTMDANTHGLYGAICNVVYYNKSFNQLSLIYNYNTLVVKNPPVQ